MGLTLTPMVRNLLFFTIGFFLLQQFVGWFTSAFSVHSFLSSRFQLYQLVTYIFLHGSLMHIFSNMFGLIMFGPMLERVWGPGRFLAFYLITGIGAALIHNGINYYEMMQMQEAANDFLSSPTPSNFADYLYRFDLKLNDPEFLENFDNNPNNPELLRQSKQVVRASLTELLDVPTLGASGAVFGIMAAFALLFPNTELFLLFFPFPIKAKYFVILYGLFEYYSGIQRNPGDNVAHFAHLGGMLFGFILVKLWGTQRNRFY
ncbi:MAG: rhomboid family intramembrane serine protease [Cytophagales bacterium]|jgi:membrane associated rhomboid family serine protease|nr:rhomboid family intramembrane serine protease [Cytophagales bacterium]